MAQHIIVQASEVWDLFQRKREFLETNQMKIAENNEFGVEIFLEESRGKPNIIAYLDDDEIYSELCMSESDCEITVQMFYDEYLTEKIINKYFGEQEDGCAYDGLTHFEKQSEIDSREAELDMAVEDFLSVALDGFVLDDVVDISGVICEDVKEHFLEYLARKWRLHIRRPMYLEDDGGEEFFEEYPYECMEFDDEDNPIYK